MKSADKQGFAAVACTTALLFVTAYAQFQLSPIAHILMPLYGLDHTEFSMLFSAAMIAGILFSLVAGLLCDRFGARVVVGVGGIATALALVARVFASDYATLFACMAASGIVATFINANLAKIMGSWFAPQRVGLAVGIALAGSPMGMSIGMGTSALFGSVNSLFLFTAAVGVAAAGAWLLFFREGPLTKRSCADQGDAIKQQPTLSACLRVALRSRNIWLIGLAAGMIMAVTMCITTFLPQALQTLHGRDPASAGVLSSMFTFGNLVGAVTTPVIVMKLGKFKPVVLVMACVAAVGTFLAWQLPSSPAIGTLLFATGFSTNGILAAIVALPILLPEIGPLYAGTAGGVIATLQLSGAVVIPSYIIVPIVGANYPVLYGIAAVLCLVVAACIAGVPEIAANHAGESNRNTTAGTFSID